MRTGRAFELRRSWMTVLRPGRDFESARKDLVPATRPSRDPFCVSW